MVIVHHPGSRMAHQQKERWPHHQWHCIMKLYIYEIIYIYVLKVFDVIVWHTPFSKKKTCFRHDIPMISSCNPPWSIIHSIPHTSAFRTIPVPPSGAGVTSLRRTLKMFLDSSLNPQVKLLWISVSQKFSVVLFVAFRAPPLGINFFERCSHLQRSEPPLWPPSCAWPEELGESLMLVAVAVIEYGYLDGVRHDQWLF